MSFVKEIFGSILIATQNRLLQTRCCMIWLAAKQIISNKIICRILVILNTVCVKNFQRKKRLMNISTQLMSLMIGESKNYSISFQMLFYLKPKVQMASNFILGLMLNQQNHFNISIIIRNSN